MSFPSVTITKFALREALLQAYDCGQKGLPEEAIDPIFNLLCGDVNKLKRAQGSIEVQGIVGLAMQGWLSKRKCKKKGQPSTMKKRYMKLTDTALYYYKTPDDGQLPLGKFELDKLKTATMMTESAEKSHLLITYETQSYEFASVEGGPSVVEWFVKLREVCPNIQIGDVPSLPVKSSKGTRRLTRGSAATRTIPKLHRRFSSNSQRRSKSSALASIGAAVVSATRPWPELDPFAAAPPPFVERALQELLARGSAEEGIFRLSAAAEDLETLSGHWKKGDDVNLAEYDVHAIACSFKAYLRELEEPLMTHAMYEPLLMAMEKSNMEERKSAIALLIYSLPPANKVTLELLLRLLRAIVRNKETTKMSAHNLAIVFAPGILGDGGQDSMDALVKMNAVQNVVQFLIEEQLRIARSPRGSEDQNFINAVEAAAVKLYSPRSIQKLAEAEQDKRSADDGGFPSPTAAHVEVSSSDDESSDSSI